MTREERVQKAVVAMADVMEAQNLSIDDMASAIFSLALRLVLVIRGLKGNTQAMRVLQASAMRLVTECMPPPTPGQVN